MKANISKFGMVLVAVGIIAISVYALKKPTATTSGSQGVKEAVSSQTSDKQLTKPKAVAFPIADALSRVTKKPFGIFVSPKNSPVKPERFTGYHTGVDFETTADEQTKDVEVFAICSGTLSYKGTVRGYGGLALERCTIDGHDVTVVYGHVRLSSVSAKRGETLSMGEKLGVLGKGYSTETSGERKHLHLGIHKGTGVNLLGYVSDQKQLESWIDIVPLLKQ